MGITWFFEFLSFMATWLWDADFAAKISIVTDIFNLSQVKYPASRLAKNKFDCKKIFLVYNGA